MCVHHNFTWLPTSYTEWSSLGSLLFIVYPRWCDLAPGRAFALNPEQQVCASERHCYCYTYSCADENGTCVNYMARAKVLKAAPFHHPFHYLDEQKGVRRRQKMLHWIQITLLRNRVCEKQYTDDLIRDVKFYEITNLNIFRNICIKWNLVLFVCMLSNCVSKETFLNFHRSHGGRSGILRNT